MKAAMIVLNKKNQAMQLPLH